MNKESGLKKNINKAFAEIAGLFPYFLIFYVAVLLLSCFSISFREFIYWPGLNVSILLLALISFISSKGRIFLSSLFSNNFLTILKKSPSLIFSWTKGRILFLFNKFKALPRVGKLKVALIILAGILALAYKISVIDLLILIYGLITLLFGLWPKAPAVFALILLILCPFLLIFKRDALVEVMAVYAYYFLIITVAVGLRELKVQEKAPD